MGQIERHLRRQRAAIGDFFLGVAQAAPAPEADPDPRPLFPLWLIMAAEGTLAERARHLTTGEE